MSSLKIIPDQRLANQMTRIEIHRTGLHRVLIPKPLIQEIDSEKARGSESLDASIDLFQITSQRAGTIIQTKKCLNLDLIGKRRRRFALERGKNIFVQGS